MKVQRKTIPDGVQKNSKSSSKRINQFTRNKRQQNKNAARNLNMKAYLIHLVHPQAERKRKKKKKKATGFPDSKSETDPDVWMNENKAMSITRDKDHEIYEITKTKVKDNPRYGRPVMIVNIEASNRR